MNRSHFYPHFLLSALVALTLSGCLSGRQAEDPDVSRTIRIKGSDTMMPLVQRWAEAFMTAHPDVAVYVEGGGSATGIQALIRGSVNICASSRPMQAEEIRELMERRGSLGITILTARDALSIYLHSDNPVQSLSMDELRGIFTGRLTGWREVGGADEPILVVNREPNSGTFLFFEEHVLLGAAYAPRAVTKPGTRGVVEAVRQNRNAVGYGGFAYAEGVRQCRVEGIEPTPENVRNGTYPIARYLYLFTVAPPKGILKQFTDWILSNEGQRIVREVGYIPLYEPSGGNAP
jgi:phosphate transport system substrate-binding protein